MPILRKRRVSSKQQSGAFKYIAFESFGSPIIGCLREDCNGLCNLQANPHGTVPDAARYCSVPFSRDHVTEKSNRGRVIITGFSLSVIQGIPDAEKRYVLKDVAGILVESAAISTMKSNIQYITVDASAPLVSFTFCLIIVHVGMGASHETNIYETTLSQPPSSRGLSSGHTLQRGSCPGQDVRLDEFAMKPLSVRITQEVELDGAEDFSMQKSASTITPKSSPGATHLSINITVRLVIGAVVIEREDPCHRWVTKEGQQNLGTNTLMTSFHSRVDGPKFLWKGRGNVYRLNEPLRLGRYEHRLPTTVPSEQNIIMNHESKAVDKLG
ncbi:hypothetical protein PUNSTDRAFT_44636 [Punctularia strigosozonata HHB-11173 SS5]|uniref:uncharacterized protein n=1 Tax=Punctularia strigosozonata (strain HHB-11173) TaxID=741275 RepID=UPI000441743C|nr:uncharacterized protein PUNSTDRAFT_44636 [Punctularia strigosozonata HHB-11173 SS5]EIN09239.1 hypothetical protein PUNSTDRAFT_44636 [Punctularia strigosozonata HHB-11173 SS5]